MKKFHFPKLVEDEIKKSPIPFAVYQFDKQRVITVSLSQGFLDLFHLASFAEAARLMDSDMYQAAHPDDVARIADLAYHFAAEGETYSAVYRNKIRDQHDYHIIHSEGRRIHTAEGIDLFVVWYMDETQNISGSPSEITRTLQAYFDENIKLSVMARKNQYDDLTGLPNMSYFIQLDSAAKPEIFAAGGVPVILYMDFSNMKLFNHHYGFAAGDNLIREFGALLRKIFGAERASRFAGDHFAAFGDGRYVEDKLKLLLQELKKINHGNVLPLRVGIYSAAFEEVGAAEACDRAKVACDSIHGSFYSKYVYYDDALHAKTMQKEYVLTHFEQAMAEKWIQAYFQPIVSSADGTVTDEEALARWIDPERGVMPPAQFIPVLEDAGLLYKMDLYMVDAIIAAQRRKKAEGLPLVPVSLNLSLRDFTACRMKDEIDRRLMAAKLDRKYLTIEITERAIGLNPELLKHVIDEFHRDGFAVWLDDFGSEYSSLNIINNFTFELFKLGMQFIQQFKTNKISKIIVEGVIEFTKKIGMPTVAEGVETEEQAEFLRRCGCTKQQGYLYSRPLPLEALLAWYKERKKQC